MITSKMRVLGIIPARLKSARIPEKMLADVAGKSLIVRTIERTQKAKSLDALVVATDSEKIAEAVKSTGISVIMTSEELKTGTDRAAAAAKLFNEFTPEIVVNIWGDEPLFGPEAIDRCVEELSKDDSLQAAVAADRLTDEKLLNEPSIVKVLTDKDSNALVFSRSPIPYPFNQSVPFEHYHVIGVMAMRREFLFKFLTLPQTPLELREGVEQMRILESGVRMRIVKGNWNNLGANTPEELEEVRQRYAKAV